MCRHNYLPDVAGAVFHRRKIPITTREVSSKLNIAHATALHHLRALEIAGYIKREQVTKTLRDSGIFKFRNRGTNARIAFRWTGPEASISWKKVSWKIIADIPNLEPA